MILEYCTSTLNKYLIIIINPVIKLKVCIVSHFNPLDVK